MRRLELVVEIKDSTMNLKIFIVLAFYLFCLAPCIEARRSNSEWHDSSYGQFVGRTSQSHAISNHNECSDHRLRDSLFFHSLEEIDKLDFARHSFLVNAIRNPFIIKNCDLCTVADLTAQFDAFYDTCVDLKSIQASCQAVIDNAIKIKETDIVALAAIYAKERATYQLINAEKQHAHVTDVLAQKISSESYNKAHHESLLELYDRHMLAKDQDLSQEKRIIKEITEKYTILEKELYGLKNSSFLKRSSIFFNRIFKGKPSLKKSIEQKQKELKECYASYAKQKKALDSIGFDKKVLEKRINQQAYSPEYKKSLELLATNKTEQVVSPEYSAAIKQTLSQEGALCKKAYNLSKEACSLLEEAGCRLEDFNSCLGNTVEQYIHNDLCVLIEKTAALPTYQEEGKQEILHFVSLSKNYSQNKQISLSLVAKKVGESLLDVAIAVAEGSFDAVKNIKNTVDFLSTTAFFVPYDQKINKVISAVSSCVQAIGGFFKEQYQLLTDDQALKEWEINQEIRNKKFAAWAQDLETRYANTLFRDKVKAVTTFAVENVLLGKAMNYLLDSSRVVNFEIQAVRLLDQELCLSKPLPRITFEEINGVWKEVEKVHGVWRVVGEAAESQLPVVTHLIENSVNFSSQICQSKARSVALVGLEKAVSSTVKPGFIDVSLFRATKTVAEVLAQESNLCELIYAKAKPKAALQSLADVADRLIHVHPEVISEKELRYLIDKYQNHKGFTGDADAPLERLLNVGEARQKVKTNGDLESLQQVHDRLVSLKGTVFELQLAEKLEVRGYVITEFGAKYWPDGIVGKRGTSPLDFDLATEDTLIEAKNRNFHSLTDDQMETMLKSFIDHKRTAHNIAGKKYLFVSGEILPEKLRQELIKNCIDFREIIT